MITYIENVMLAPKLQINDNDEHTKLLVAMFKPKLHMVWQYFLPHVPLDNPLI